MLIADCADSARTQSSHPARVELFMFVISCYVAAAPIKAVFYFGNSKKALWLEVQHGRAEFHTCWLPAI
jgi:hypothetical protein